jgi:hypothetical protein
MEETAPAPPAGATTASRRRTVEALRERTAELELLISGAVLFALFRLSAVADETFFRLLLNLGGGLLKAAIIAFEYAKLILYSLIAAFVGHLALRAWWVGLVGLDAVFPGGPRWDRLPSYGPVTLDLYRQEMPRLQRMIARADAAASVVFAAGLAFAALFGFTVVGSVLIGVLAWGLSAVVPDLPLELLFLAVSALAAAYLMAVGLVDRVWGQRLLAVPRRGAALRRAVRAGFWLAGSRVYAPLTLLLASNLPRRRVYLGFALGIGLVLALFVVRDVLLGYELLGFDSQRFLPARPGAAGFDPRYYDRHRPPSGPAWRLPSLESELATGPYLRLFVPFTPERVDEGARALCPGLVPLREPGLRFEPRSGQRAEGDTPARLTAVRDCLLRLVRVELDGARVGKQRFLLGVHPTSGARGLLAQLPVASLLPGEHRLVVRETALPRQRRAPREHWLLFWR